MNLSLTVLDTTRKHNIKRKDKSSNTSIFGCSLIGPRNERGNRTFQFIAMCVCV